MTLIERFVLSSVSPELAPANARTSEQCALPHEVSNPESRLSCLCCKASPKLFREHLRKPAIANLDPRYGQVLGLALSARKAAVFSLIASSFQARIPTKPYTARGRPSLPDYGCSAKWGSPWGVTVCCRISP